VIREQLSTMLKTAMKAGDKRRVGTVRLIQSALKDKDIELREFQKETTDEDITAVLLKMVKQRRDSIALYEQGNREDLAAQEREELAIIAEFLPQAMSDDEVHAAIVTAIDETGATGPKDMGKVIAALKAKHAGRIDFAKASGEVKTLLAQKG
jgi:uncharacterized protein